MWPVVIFAALVALVVLEAVWRERRHRSERRAAQREFNAALVGQQREAIAAADAQRQTLFNSMVEGVLLLGADGRVQLVNESLRHLFQLSGDVRGQLLAEVFRAPELLALPGRLQKEQTLSAVEFLLPGSPSRNLEVSGSIVADSSGAPRPMLFLFHDLTALKELENTRRDFVANVSHELRTPLSLIKGYVETLLDGAKDDPQVAEKFLRTIEKHTDRLSFLIDDLLIISRLESGQGALNLQPVEVRETVERVVSDLQSRSQETGVTVRNQVAPGLQVLADADRLEQVFFNLLENALKYGRAGGWVEISSRDPVTVGLVEISVADNGPGIPLEAQPRIFERFFRVDRARARETGGTGLGLAIVKHIVQAHAGEVGVESEPGRGTRFYFTLPAPAPELSHDCHTTALEP